VAERSPTLRRRELARRLRELRLQAGLTVEAVAHELLCSPPKISRIETGTRSPSLRDVRDLGRLYHVSDAEQQRLMAIAQEAKQPGWWEKFDDLANIDTLIGLEIAAKRISSHEAAIVPWIFQTEQYARAVVKGILPRIDDRVLDERVTARIIRQELLTRPEPPDLWFWIDESALRRAVGGNHVMREQLSKILEISASPNVTMQIVRFEVGAHPALGNVFTLLEFDSPLQPPVVFVESLAGNLYLDRNTEIERYQEIVQNLKKLSLSPASSAEFIEEIRRTFEELSRYASEDLRAIIRKEFVVSNSPSSLLDIPWRTAVKSGESNCVQVARRDGVIMVAHSKRPSGPILSYTLEEWDAFLDGAKKGEFDDFVSSQYPNPSAVRSSRFRNYLRRATLVRLGKQSNQAGATASRGSQQKEL
jgi:transcriptional regulator with XRE-family HTH domain